jgi:hypothetical protein
MLAVILIATAVVALIFALATLRALELEKRVGGLDAKLEALSEQVSEIRGLAQATDKRPQTASAPVPAAPTATVRPKIELPTIIRPRP